MDIEHITGPDAIPGGFSPSYTATQKPERAPEEGTSRQPPPAEENKGNYVDTYA